ncbi:aspartate--tRNA ligase dps1 [Taxawa tesnikishii (nom. ined.)]|nr:aspartate--tRNA ligase dps1 [Dothideales sp. JES 119]
MSALKKAFHSLKHRDRDSASSSAVQSEDESPRRSTDSPRKSMSGLSNGGHGRRSGEHTPRQSTTEHRPTHSPLGAFRNKLRRDSSSSSSSDGGPLNRDGEHMSKAQLRKHEKLQEKERHQKEAEQHAEADRKKREEAERRAKEGETPDMAKKYGVLPINNYAGGLSGDRRIDLLELNDSHIGKSVVFRARLHSLRNISAHLVFMVLRQQTTTIQGLIHEHAGVGTGMIYFAEHLHLESVLCVKGVVQEPKAKQGEIIGTSIHSLEISIHELYVEAAPTEPLPFNVGEAEVTEEETKAEDDPRHRVSDRARLANRIIDLRTTTSQSIFRIQSGVSTFFRQTLLEQGFIEIHTPKLQGGATESGASVFKLDYFGRPAFLAQSPQLAKQMCISADFRKVFEIGAVFRAENSNTHRHMTEYTGLDLEMAIDEHYHEVLRVLDHTFKSIFAGVYKHFRHEIDTLKKHFPTKTSSGPRRPLSFLSNKAGHKKENGEPLPEDEDLGTRDEIALGKLVKEKYHTDYYVLDKFPTGARPFYAMPDPNDPRYTNSFDIFLRGQEILSGGQRIHDAKTLRDNMEKLKMNPDDLEDYMQGFEWGAPPHGGGGIGLERMLMLLLQLGDIRHATLFPRDPKSLPAKPAIKQLRHPEASTLHPPWEGKDRTLAHMELQPLEKLIANYGDASNTSWLEPRTEIWRDEHTGAAVGFVPHQGYAITVGDPLCHQSQYVKTMSGYLRYIKKERNLKPLWLLCGHAVEEALASKFNWRTFSVAAEQRLDPGNNPAQHDHDIQRKIRHAEKEGVKIHDIPIGEPVSDDVRQKIDKRVKDWLANRKGKQVHLTDVHPWQDMEHRQYHYSVDKEGTICGLVILAQLSPDHGWQVKFSLDFPGAPSGAIEALVMHALKACAAMGATSVTFGGGASNRFTPGHNLKGTRVKVLSKAYHAIASELHLTAKSEFREKLGAQEDPIYVCYPPHGLGPGGIRAIMSFFEDED